SLAKFSTQGREFVLPVVDPAAEKAPMARVPYIRKVIAQLHDVATVFEDEQRCDRMARYQGRARCQEVCSSQNSPLARLAAYESCHYVPETACHYDRGGYKTGGRARSTGSLKCHENSIA